MKLFCRKFTEDADRENTASSGQDETSNDSDATNNDRDATSSNCDATSPDSNAPCLRAVSGHTEQDR